MRKGNNRNYNKRSRIKLVISLIFLCLFSTFIEGGENKKRNTGFGILSTGSEWGIVNARFWFHRPWGIQVGGSGYWGSSEDWDLLLQGALLYENIKKETLDGFFVLTSGIQSGKNRETVPGFGMFYLLEYLPRKIYLFEYWVLGFELGPGLFFIEQENKIKTKFTFMLGIHLYLQNGFKLREN